MIQDFTEADAKLADVMANWYERQMIAHRINCDRNCKHWFGMRKARDDSRQLANKIREYINEGLSNSK